MVLLGPDGERPIPGRVMYQRTSLLGNHLLLSESSKRGKLFDVGQHEKDK